MLPPFSTEATVPAIGRQLPVAGRFVFISPCRGGYHPPVSKHFFLPFGGVYMFGFADSRGRLSLQGLIYAVRMIITMVGVGAHDDPKRCDFLSSVGGVFVSGFAGG